MEPLDPQYVEICNTAETIDELWTRLHAIGYLTCRADCAEILDNRAQGIIVE